MAPPFRQGGSMSKLTLAFFLLMAFDARADRDDARTATPVKHLIVIFQENVSFDHYFATYPHALNPAGEAEFRARYGTPSVNGLNDGLLTKNPNTVQPFRLGRNQAVTCDQDHD